MAMEKKSIRKKIYPERSRRVFVATYTNEGLKFQMVLGPLKFEPLRRGRPTRSTNSGQAIMV